jgi:hypothetical protein
VSDVFEMIALYKEKAANLAVERLFKNRIINENGCWLWTKGKDKDGYGKITVADVSWLVHRFAMAIFKPEEFAEYLKVLHNCDTPACFNPEHLYSGTGSDNKQDEIRRGRNFNNRKTHCINGHEFTSENTINTKEGWRKCKTCQTKLTQANYARRTL